MRCHPARRFQTAALLAVCALGACKRYTPEVTSGGESYDLPPQKPTASVIVESFPDELHANTLRDSLQANGWAPFITRGAVQTKKGSVTGWRVHVLPTASEEIAELAAGVFRGRGRKNAAVAKGGIPSGIDDIGAMVWPVNRGPHGMAARTRWALSPDQRALLAMEDPVGVEAEPVPNGGILASEVTNRVMPVDTVWDAQPSPDWKLLAVGKAYVVRGGANGDVADAQWRALALRLPSAVTADIAPGSHSPAWEAWVVAQLRAHAFPASGMGPAVGIGIAEVIPIDSLLGVDPAQRTSLDRPRALRFDGWQVRWKGDDTVAVGAAPRFPRDNSSSPAWYLERATVPGSLGQVADTNGFAKTAWVEGPSLDVSKPTSFGGTTTIQTRRLVIEAVDGWIHVSRRGMRADGTAARIVGPGKPLAATANGRFLVALVPRPEAKQGEVNASLVLYRIVY